MALITISRICSGQADTVRSGFFNNPEIKVTYNSSLIYPGLSIGAGFRIKEKDAPRRKGGPGLVPVRRDQLVSLNLNWYHHPGFHDNLYLTPEWTFRKTRGNGYFSEFSVGPGYSRTFLGGTTYIVRDDESIETRKNAGYSYAMITAGWGAGYSFLPGKGLPLRISAKMNLITMFPYNSTVYFRPVLELGVRFDTSLISEFKKRKE
jgi:hypothetical protein